MEPQGTRRRSGQLGFGTAAAELMAAHAEIGALNARLTVMQPVGDKAKAVMKEIDTLTKLMQKAHEALVAKGDRQIEVQTSDAATKRVTAEVRKIAAEGKKLMAGVAEARVALTGDPAVQMTVTGSLKRFRYFEGQAHWLLSRFPDGVLRDVQGLVKLVDHAELAANDGQKQARIFEARMAETARAQRGARLPDLRPGRRLDLGRRPLVRSALARSRGAVRGGGARSGRSGHRSGDAASFTKPAAAPDGAVEVYGVRAKASFCGGRI